jgi:hypothetical protein
MSTVAGHGSLSLVCKSDSNGLDAVCIASNFNIPSICFDRDTAEVVNMEQLTLGILQICGAV